MKNPFKIIFTLMLTLGLACQAVASGGGDNKDDTRLKDIAEYNLSENIAIKGYDPVSYFPEGGGVPLKGDSDLSVDFSGVTYKFVNEKNMSLFLDEIEKNKKLNIKDLKYEPTYGGWCAYAMGIDGSKVDIDPTLFDFTGDRLHLFFSQGTLNGWVDNKESLEKSADRRWVRILKRARR